MQGRRLELSSPRDRSQYWLLVIASVFFGGALSLESRPTAAACDSASTPCVLDRRYGIGEAVTELLQAPPNPYNRKILAGGITDADFGFVPSTPATGYQWAGLQYRSGDTFVASGPRAEYQDVNRPYNVDRFYRAHVHIPRDYELGSDGYSFRIFMQWHEGKGSPPFSLQLDASTGTIKLVRKAYNASTGAVSFPVVKSWPVGEWLGTTRLIVVQAKWLKTSEGHFRLWLDPDGTDYESPDASYAGATIQEGSTTQPVYWKWGTYGKPSKYFYTGMAISEAGGRAGYDAVMPAPTLAIALAPTNSVLPTVSGLATVPETLSATSGTWSGVPEPMLTYEWRRCDAAGGSCAAIAGAVGPGFSLGAADVGSTLRVHVTATNTAGTTSAVSQPTSVVTGALPANTTIPTVSGTTVVLQALVTTDGVWTGAPTFSYQWQRCDPSGGACYEIAGAVSKTYILSDADVGRSIRTAVVATNSAGSATATSSPSTVVGGIAPVATAPPVVTGVAVVSQLLESSTGTWSGIPAPAYAHQWRRCDATGAACLDIAGATQMSYLLTDADLGKTMRVAVVASSLAGTSTSVSAATAAVASPPAQFVRRSQGIASSKTDSLSLSISNVSVKSGESLIVSVLARSSGGTIKSVKWGTHDVPVVGSVQSVAGIGDTPRFATFYLQSPSPRTAKLVVTFTGNARASVLSYEVVQGLGRIDRHAVASGTGTAVTSGLTAATSPGTQYHYGVIGCACPQDDPAVSLGGSITRAGQRGGTLGAPPNALIQTGYGEQTTSGMKSVSATLPTARTWVAQIISFAAR